MSKGPGAVQRRLTEIFTKRGHGIFSTVELCRIVYRVAEVRKKHRVAVLRGIARLADIEELNIYRAVVKGVRNDYWLNYDGAKRALNRLLLEVGAKNVDFGPARERRPRKRNLTFGEDPRRTR